MHSLERAIEASLEHNNATDANALEPLNPEQQLRKDGWLVYLSFIFCPLLTHLPIALPVIIPATTRSHSNPPVCTVLSSYVPRPTPCVMVQLSFMVCFTCPRCARAWQHGDHLSLQECLKTASLQAGQVRTRALVMPLCLC